MADTRNFTTAVLLCKTFLNSDIPYHFEYRFNLRAATFEV